MEMPGSPPGGLNQILEVGLLLLKIHRHTDHKNSPGLLKMQCAASLRISFKPVFLHLPGDRITPEKREREG